MRSGREIGSLAAERGHKESSMKKLIIHCATALRNDLIDDDYLAAVEMIDFDDALRGRRGWWLHRYMKMSFVDVLRVSGVC